MDTLPGITPKLNAYQLRLPVFEGPLDVLLRLIEREQLPIAEVSLITVFDQFMAFMFELESLRPEVIAEFATVAGRLSVLKSRSLLPRPPQPIDEPDELDLVRQLEAYRAIKTAADLLADRQRDGAGAFCRGESVAWPAAEPARLLQQQPSALSKAVQRWLTRVPSGPIDVAIQRVLTLQEMISRIGLLLEKQRTVSFDRVRGACSSRQDVAVAFLALLTLMRRQMILVSQAELFGPITLERSIRPLSETPLAAVDMHGADGSQHAGA